MTSPSRINFHRREMAVGCVIVGQSRFPHESYSLFLSSSDTLGNSINRSLHHALFGLDVRRRERERKERLVSTSTLHFSKAVVTLRRAGERASKQARARSLKIAEEFAPSVRKSKVTLKSASGSVPREAATFAASLARGMHYFAAWKCPRTGNRCRIA